MVGAKPFKIAIGYIWLKADLPHKCEGGAIWHERNGGPPHTWPKRRSGNFRMVICSKDDPDCEGIFLAPGPHKLGADMLAQLHTKQ